MTKTYTLLTRGGKIPIDTFFLVDNADTVKLINCFSTCWNIFLFILLKTHMILSLVVNYRREWTVLRTWSGNQGTLLVVCVMVRETGVCCGNKELQTLKWQNSFLVHARVCRITGWLPKAAPFIRCPIVSHCIPISTCASVVVKAGQENAERVSHQRLRTSFRKWQPYFPDRKKSCR